MYFTGKRGENIHRVPEVKHKARAGIIFEPPSSAYLMDGFVVVKSSDPDCRKGGSLTRANSGNCQSLVESVFEGKNLLTILQFAVDGISYGRIIRVEKLWKKVCYEQLEPPNYFQLVGHQGDSDTPISESQVEALIRTLREIDSGVFHRPQYQRGLRPVIFLTMSQFVYKACTQRQPNNQSGRIYTGTCKVLEDFTEGIANEVYEHIHDEERKLVFDAFDRFKSTVSDIIDITWYLGKFYEGHHSLPARQQSADLDAVFSQKYPDEHVLSLYRAARAEHDKILNDTDSEKISSEERDDVINLIASDGREFHLLWDNAVIKHCKYLQLLSKRIVGSDVLEFPEIQGSSLEKLVEFCSLLNVVPMGEIEKPLRSPNLKDVVPEVYADFTDIEQDVLFQLIMLANQFDCPQLLDLTSAKVASMIKGKTPEEIRQTFNIVNDFTPEEEAQVREENRWCEEA